MTVVDLESKNGTYVRGERIQSAVVVADGDGVVSVSSSGIRDSRQRSKTSACSHTSRPSRRLSDYSQRVHSADRNTGANDPAAYRAAPLRGTVNAPRSTEGSVEYVSSFPSQETPTTMSS